MVSMRVTCGAVIVLASLAAACESSPSPERQLVDRAIAWMGGIDRLTAVRSLVIEGDGTVTLFGQALGSGGIPPFPEWRVTGWRRTLDLTGNRMSERQVRVPLFTSEFAPPPPLSGGLDGAVGYDVAPDGTARRTSAAVAAERRIEMLHHPLVLLRAAMQPGARLANRRVQSGYEVIDLTTAERDIVSLGFDPAFGMLTMAWSPSYQRNLGDVTVETGFYRYVEERGLRLPLRIVSRLDRFPQNDLQVTSNVLDADSRELAAPEAVRASAIPPDTAAPHVTVDVLAPGVWRLAGDTHHSVVIEFADHVRIFEVPISEARTLAVIETARKLGQGKPVTHAIISHHHFDHAAGLRAAIAEGLTIVTERENAVLFGELAVRSHSRNPDALERRRRPPTFDLVGGELRTSDEVNQLRVVKLLVEHSYSMLIADVASRRLVIQADLFGADDRAFPQAWRLLDLVRNSYAEGDIAERHVPVHGRPMTHAELLRIVRAVTP